MKFIAGAVLGGLAVWVLRNSVTKAFESGKERRSTAGEQAARVPGGPRLVAPGTVLQE